MLPFFFSSCIFNAFCTYSFNCIGALLQRHHPHHILKRCWLSHDLWWLHAWILTGCITWYLLLTANKRSSHFEFVKRFYKADWRGRADPFQLFQTHLQPRVKCECFLWMCVSFKYHRFNCVFILLPFYVFYSQGDLEQESNNVITSYWINKQSTLT